MKFITFAIGIYYSHFDLHIAIALVAAQGLDPTIPITEHIVTPQPWEYMANEELPKEYDPYLSRLTSHF